MPATSEGPAAAVDSSGASAINHRYGTPSFVKTICFLAVLALVTTSPRVGSWNDASRMATIQALVERRSFIIDDSVFADTGDKVFINGHYYSDKPALPSILGSTVYLPLFLLGIKLDYGWNAAYYLITLFTVKLLWLAGLTAFYRALGFTGAPDKDRLRLTLALGIASLHFTWSATFNNHSLVASLLIIGYYFLLKARQGDGAGRDLFLAGLFLALAGMSDIPFLAFYLGFSAYVVFHPVLRKRFLLYGLPLLVIVLPAWSINYQISGQMVPVQIIRSYWEYPGSPWIGSTGVAGTAANPVTVFLTYGFKALLGPRGFLLYNPFLFVALPCLIGHIMNGQPLRSDALVIGIISLTVVLYFLIFTNNYGGWCYSVRWFVPLLPLLFFFMHGYFRSTSANRTRLFNTLFCISTVISCIGLVDPWTSPRLSETPLVANVKELLLVMGRGR